MERFIISAAKKIAYALAACVVLVACFVVTGWLLAPYFDKHRVDVEKLASEYAQRPIVIQRVSLSWDQYQPVIRLRNVTVMDDVTHQPVIQIEKVSVFFSLWESLRHLKFMPGGVLISGTELNVHQEPSGNISIQGFPVIDGGQPFQQETSIREIMSVLFLQSRIILRNIDVSFTDKANKKREFTLYNLSMRNSGDQHVIVGKAVLHQDIPTEVSLTVGLNGTAEAFEQIKADAYLYVSGFSLSQWLRGAVWQGWRVDKGIGSAKVWATWEQGAFQRVQTLVQLYDLQLHSATDGTTHRLTRVSGDVGWKRNGSEIVLAADDILLNFSDHLWPSTSFYVAVTQGADGSYSPKTVKLGYVDISDVKAVLFASPISIPDAVKKALVGTKFDGVLQHVVVEFPGEVKDLAHTTMDVAFSHLAVSPWQHYPGINNLSGVAKWDGVKGALTLNSSDFVFRYSPVFANALEVDQLVGDIEISNHNDVWQLSTTNLQLLNKDLIANVTGSFSIPANGEVRADIKSNFSMTSAKHITRYLPMKIFGPDLVEWLQEAFFAGKIESGTAQLTGKLSDFPFEKGNGVFQIAGNVNNVDFRFAPDWPKLTQVSGKMVFSGNQMTVDVNQGRMMDIAITNAHAHIPYLGDAKPNMLYIKSENIQSDMAAGMAFIHASPLEQGIGKMFTGMEMSGPISLNLNLTVPLANPEKLQVQGDLTIDDASINLVPWDLRIDKLGGLVHFTRDTTTSGPLTGTLFNKPVTIQLATIEQAKSAPSFVRATVTHQLAINDVESWLKIPLSKVATGASNITANIDMALDAPIVVNVKSNLQGIALDLPDQYAKKSHQPQNFTANITVRDGKPLQAKLGYGKLLSAALIFDKINQEFKLIAADLRLGGGDPAWPKSDGIYITGTIDALNWDKIKSYLDQSGSGKSALDGYTLKEINVLIKQLDVFGQKIASAQVSVIPSVKNWQVNIDSAQVKGGIHVPVDFSPAATISAQFERLSLLAATGPQQSVVVDFKTLPAISLSANDMSYNGMQLGQVTVKTRPINNGQVIETMRLASRNVDLRASGTWMASGKGYKTSMQGTVDSDHVSDFLNGLGADAHNFIAGKGRAAFDLSWNDAFYSPDVATLNGRFSLDLGPGRIVDVGDTTGAKMDLGKMLSIFSLQTIPRRLSLDFSDIFQKGYSFDFLRGDYTLTNGNVYTNNMRIEGPVAKLAINGRIGLSKKDVDFILNVTPYVTSSIPVAAGLITANPLVGLGALAVNTVIGSQVSKVVTYRYDVKGSWSNPSWQQVDASAGG